MSRGAGKVQTEVMLGRARVSWWAAGCGQGATGYRSSDWSFVLCSMLRDNLVAEELSNCVNPLGVLER